MEEYTRRLFGLIFSAGLFVGGLVIVTGIIKISL